MKRSVIDTVDLSVEEVQQLLDTAMDIIAAPEKYAHACAGRKLATLFFEPSTRTRMSFEAAMYELGGNVISMTDAGTSSAAKGETVADTAKVVSNYVDIIAQRHPKAGAALVAATNASIPVINAGDGGHCHPTQTFADLLTIYREHGNMNGLTIGFCGDLLYGRTVHSLMAAMARYEGTRFVLISPEELRVPRHLIEDVVEPAGIPCEEVTSLEEALPKLDVLYMTRIQKERFDDPVQYERLKNVYVLDGEKMKLAKPDCIVMHPLPRVDEIAVEVDDDPRARYAERQIYAYGPDPEAAGLGRTEPGRRKRTGGDLPRRTVLAVDHRRRGSCIQVRQSQMHLRRRALHPLQVLCGQGRQQALRVLRAVKTKKKSPEGRLFQK